MKLHTYLSALQSIREDIDHFGGRLPDDAIIAWHAYITALGDWHVIDEPSRKNLLDLLPLLPESNPVIDVVRYVDLPPYTASSSGSVHPHRGWSMKPSDIYGYIVCGLQNYAESRHGAIVQEAAIAWHAYISAIAKHGIASSLLLKRVYSILPRLTEPNAVSAIDQGYGNELTEEA
jgi:hypothetical protein